MKIINMKGGSLSRMIMAYVIRPHIAMSCKVNFAIHPSDHGSEEFPASGMGAKWKFYLDIMDDVRYAEVDNTLNPFEGKQRKIMFCSEYNDEDWGKYPCFDIDKIQKYGKKLIMADPQVSKLYVEFTKDVEAYLEDKKETGFNVQEVFAEIQQRLDTANAAIVARITELYPSASALADAIIASRTDADDDDEGPGEDETTEE